MDGDKPEARIKLKEPLPGKMLVGSELRFSGVVVTFTKSPYVLTVESELGDIEGWTGKAAPGARGGAAKKGPAPAAAPATKKKQ